MRATDPIILFLSQAFEYLLTFIMVWLIALFIALPIGMGKEEQEGKAADVKRKFLYSALASAIIAGGIFYLANSDKGLNFFNMFL